MSSTMRLEPDKLINHYRSVAISEFADSLYETSLNSNDVDGILRLSKSAHICRVLESVSEISVFMSNISSLCF
jgi:hypothetical protein